MIVRCPYCMDSFDAPEGSMEFSCPKCGRKLNPSQVLMATEFKKPPF